MVVRRHVIRHWPSTGPTLATDRADNPPHGPRLLKLLGTIPWLAMLAGMPFVNRPGVFVLGLPLPLAWAIGCTLLAAAVLALVFTLDPANRA